MRILVVGSGAREHALAWKLSQSPSVERLFCAPGNAGTAAVAQNLPVDAQDVERLRDAAEQLGADLTVVGPEAPLAAGVVDAFEARGLRVFGPTLAAARLEWSKAWTKDFLLRHGVPTGRARVVEDEPAARRALAAFGLPVVVKADGLASGKGVFVCDTADAVEQALGSIFGKRAFGSAGDRVLVEECLVGPELSVLAFADGERFALMPPARDHKRLLDGDRGPNTGGMGAYAPPADATSELLERVARDVIQPTLAGMAAEGHPYHGLLYAGLMLTADGPSVLEFNCRFGDPETQVVLPLLDADLAEVCLAVAERRLDPTAVRWQPGAACGVVLAAAGYPEHPRHSDTIHGLDTLPADVLAFQAGTRPGPEGGLPVTAGGRVLTLVARGGTLHEARERVYAAVPGVRFAGVQYRSDIGREPRLDARLAHGGSETRDLTPASRGGA